MSGEAAGSAAWEMGRRPEGSFDLASMVSAFRWQVDAACKGVGVADFYAEREEGESNHGHEAKALCAVCPVIGECLVYSLERQESHGIWAGAGEARRRELRRAWKYQEDEPDQWERIRDDHLARVRLFALPVTEREVALAAMGLPERVPSRDSGGPTHGIRATYARGCRCMPCLWSVTVLAQLLARVPVSTAEFWAERAPWGWEGRAFLEVRPMVDRTALPRLLEPDALAVPKVWAWLVGLERHALAASGREAATPRDVLGAWLLAALDGNRLADRWPASYPRSSAGLAEAA